MWHSGTEALNLMYIIYIYIHTHTHNIYIYIDVSIAAARMAPKLPNYRNGFSGRSSRKGSNVLF